MVLAGRTLPLNGIRFRQDNDFFYLTGNEDTNAVLAIDAPSGDSWLFLPPQNASEVRSDGKNWLTMGDQAKPRGFTAIAPITELGEFLARRRAGGAGRPLYTRLSERDEVDDSRGELGVGLARRMSNPLGARPSDDAWRVEMLRQHFPAVELKDVTPAIDALRVIKSPREIEILTLNGRLSAEAIRKAIEITRPGRFEYELEAEATYHLFKNGVQGNGYPAIVGTGPNVNVWHYQDNGRQMKAGDLVVMDYGGSLDYQVIDITRTWPVSGRFDELQLRAYQCALETQKAIIAAMRPGATRAETREISKRIYEKWGFADQRPAQAGHFVGMSVHDVGDYAAPFRPGMVIAVEPIIEIADKHLHIRIEDTVLITEGAPVILSAAVPKEVDEVLALMKQAGHEGRAELQFRRCYNAFHSHSSAASATSGAASARRVRPPRLNNVAPAAASASTSAGAQPPSGPTSTVAVSGRGGSAAVPAASDGSANAISGRGRRVSASASACGSVDLGHDGPAALLHRVERHALPPLHARDLAGARRRHLGARGHQRADDVDAQHRGIAHDVVELVALEQRRRQREAHRHLRRRRRLRADAHLGALPGRHLDARRRARGRARRTPGPGRRARAATPA